MEQISLENMEKYSDLIVEYGALYGSQLILAILTLLIGLWIIGAIVRGFDKALKAAKVEETLAIFLEKLAGTILKVLLLISVAGMVGIETTSFIAIFGAAGLAIGLALQGSLANFAGGVLILLFKPYKVGDFIEAQGQTGIVKEIQIFNTILHTGDRKTIIIPNGPISNGTITNYSLSPIRRVDMVFGIGYDDDLKQAKSILEQLVAEDDRILKDHDNQVLLSELADSSVNFTVRMFVNSADYWGVFFDMNEKVKLTFDAQGISIPYPQQDVHLQLPEGFQAG
ncbi:mechanosensitive ion channel family protein [Motiliproteus coralliicola]|uniref:Small-conductance mechanosensitive channel n=1 Tax=Motiliproteus coralliicola TaxID=2283196 RepID=A0A369WL83_9GAMM|nr:mechanosensitive ion channel domain-containing protein [Motiliproteus coralliicola]RDE22838.1 mechanosensitive ion channel family protein [Motiliproteus coralliicola]